MKNSDRRRSLRGLAALLSAVLALAAAPVPVAAAAGDAKVLAVVNGENVTEGDVAVARNRIQGEKVDDAWLLGKIVESVLLRQEARRTGVDKSAEYARQVKDWRQKQAARMIGVEEVRKAAPAGRGPRPGFAEFYRQWGASYEALPEKERKAADEAIARALNAARGGVTLTVDEGPLAALAALTSVPAEVAAKTVVGVAPWGKIMLLEVLAAEPQTVGHVGQTTSDVVRMWRQIAEEIAAREQVLRVAEAAGYFQVPAVRAEESAAKDRILREVFLAAHYREKIRQSNLPEEVGRRIAEWTRLYALEARTIVFGGGVPKEQVLARYESWSSSTQPLPTELPGALITHEPLDSAWPRFSADLRRAVSQQPWRTLLRPWFEGGSYWLVMTSYGKNPGQRFPTMESLATAEIEKAAYAALVKGLEAKARITYP